jgi:hypothetical protein
VFTAHVDLREDVFKSCVAIFGIPVIHPKLLVAPNDSGAFDQDVETRDASDERVDAFFRSNIELRNASRNHGGPRRFEAVRDAETYTCGSAGDQRDA